MRFILMRSINTGQRHRVSFTDIECYHKSFTERGRLLIAFTEVAYRVRLVRPFARLFTMSFNEMD